MKKRLIKLIILLGFSNNFLCNDKKMKEICEIIEISDNFFNDFEVKDLIILKKLTNRKLKIINNLLKICNIFKKYSKDDIKKIIEGKISVNENLIRGAKWINDYIYSEKEGFINEEIKIINLIIDKYKRCNKIVMNELINIKVPSFNLENEKENPEKRMNQFKNEVEILFDQNLEIRLKKLQGKVINKEIEELPEKVLNKNDDQLNRDSVNLKSYETKKLEKAIRNKNKKNQQYIPKNRK